MIDRTSAMLPYNTDSISDVCLQEPELTSSGYLEAMINYVKLCIEEPKREIMLEVLNSELSKLQMRNLLPMHELVLLILVYTAMILFGSCGSLFVIYVVVRQPRMRTPRNLFIVNLATSDLILCLFTQPFNLLRTLYWHYDWTLGQVMCKAVAMAQAANIFVSTISIIAIALDRLQVIVYPTRNKVHTAGAIGIIGSSWILSLLMASPMIAFSSVSHGTIRSDGSVCSANTIQSKWLRQSKFIYGILTLIFQYCLPITIVSYAYTRICLRIRERRINRRTLRFNEMLSELASEGMINPHKAARGRDSDKTPAVNGESQMSISTHALMQQETAPMIPNQKKKVDLETNNIGQKPVSYTMVTAPITANLNPAQDREKLIQRRHTRTNALLVAVTVTFILAWLPLHIFNLAMDFKESRSASDINQLDNTELELPTKMHESNWTNPISYSVPDTSPSETQFKLTGRFWTLIHSFCLFCVLLSACINPVLYGWLNENFHKEFKQMCTPCSRGLCFSSRTRRNLAINSRAQNLNEVHSVINKSDH